MLQLPAAAKVRDPAQPIWPVRLDHCFGRIILDAVVGVDRPWREKLAAPAVRNMSTEQLEACVAMGRDMLSGKADLMQLNQKSLVLRGKGGKGNAPGLRADKGEIKKEESAARTSTRTQYTQTTLRTFTKATAQDRKARVSKGITRKESE
jgi:hypothetical protein